MLNDPIHFAHVKGHASNEPNEIADFLAGQGELGKVSMYFRPKESNEFYISWLRTSQNHILKYEDGTNLIRDDSGKPLVKDLVLLYKESKKPKYHLHLHTARERERDWGPAIVIAENSWTAGRFVIGGDKKKSVRLGVCTD